MITIGLFHRVIQNLDPNAVMIFETEDHGPRGIGGIVERSSNGGPFKIVLVRRSSETRISNMGELSKSIAKFPADEILWVEHLGDVLSPIKEIRVCDGECVTLILQDQ